MGFLAFAKACLVVSLSVWFASAQKSTNAKTFDVKDYGAIADGKTENSKAFLRAWEEACKCEERAVVLIPRGDYILDSVVFSGQHSRCQDKNIAFFLKGVLKPPTNLSNREQWISFEYIKGLTVSGGGFLDGQGQKVWNCGNSPNCRATISLGFGFIENGRISHLRSINSRNAHIVLFGCKNVTLTHLRLKAPGRSPNTDGIKIGSSSHIKVLDSRISTGDDCIALLNGSRSISVRNVYCGPGHGISVGSMGMNLPGDTIVGVHVQNCTLNHTTSGLRIKTWATPLTGLACRITYEDIRMIDVAHPILIDQFYCPNPPCDQKTPSKVQIRDITYKNIWGSSRSRVAVNLNCSRSVPCKNLVFENINLSFVKGKTKSLCSNAIGRSYGEQQPPCCF